MKKLMYAVMPIIIVITFSFLFRLFLNKEVDRLIKVKDLSEVRHTYNEKSRDTGDYLMNYFASQDDLMLLGSSELGRQVPGNPVNIFPCTDGDYDVSIYGIAHMQDLNQALRLGSNTKVNSKSKVAIIVSMQWFNKQDGVMKQEFSSVFSELQFYKFLENPKISKKNKEKFVKRISDLLDSNYKEEKVFAQLYLRKGIKENVLYYLALPYYKAKISLLDTRDKLLTYLSLVNLPNKSDTKKEIKHIDFEKAYVNAVKTGEKQVTNGNPFNVQDKFYNINLKNNRAVFEGRDSHINLMASAEFKDYQLFLDVCKDLAIEPYVILMNANGWYYDYLGITKNERTEFYNELESIAEARGYKVLNLQPHEYEKYYLIDTMHLGWIGWLDVSNHLAKNFKECK